MTGVVRKQQLNSNTLSKGDPKMLGISRNTSKIMIGREKELSVRDSREFAGSLY
jgi:hypothetical protein